MDYPSQAEAARALGISPVTVCKALESGRIDTCGKGNDNRRPIVLHGLPFASLGDVDVALGMASGYTSNTLGHKSTRRRELLSERLRSYAEKNNCIHKWCDLLNGEASGI